MPHPNLYRYSTRRDRTERRFRATVAGLILAGLVLIALAATLD